MPIIIFSFFILLSDSVFADNLHINTIMNSCGNASAYKAIFEINKYNCLSGYYLPAGATACQKCPNNHECNGGNFTYNPTITQGLEDGNILIENAPSACINNFGQNFSALFTINSYSCTTGYYLPANVDECTICPINNKCVGGTFTFNEITPQGIEPCANDTFAPPGSAVCYPHILHVGNDNIYMKSVKTTTPSLNIRVGNDIFYANMTTVQTYMSANSEHYLKTVYNNEIYYVCDDTMCDNAE